MGVIELLILCCFQSLSVEHIECSSNLGGMALFDFSCALTDYERIIFMSVVTYDAIIITSAKRYQHPNKIFISRN